MNERVPSAGDTPPGPDEPRDLRSLVRHKLKAGVLPKVEEARLLLNLGLVSPCDACGSPITGMEHIAEFHDGRKFRFHAQCSEAWQHERRAGGDQARFVIPQPDWEGNNPEVPCAACGFRIRPFDERYVLQSASFHPKCYDRGQAEEDRRREDRDAPPTRDPVGLHGYIGNPPS